MSELTMDPATHTYRLDGRVLPSVTQVLDAAGLTGSRAFIPEFALDRGREVHRAVELYLKGEADDYDFDPEHVAPRLAAFRAWREGLGARLEVVAVEVPCAHATLQYAGTPDLLARLDGVKTVVELKNGTEHPSHRLQAAAYAMMTGAPGRLGLYLTGDGPAKPVPWTGRQDAGIFQSALCLWQFRAQHNLLPA